MITKYLSLAVLFGALALTGRSAGLPEKVRVLTLDLESARIETPGVPGSELSQELRRFLEMADVDLICLQGVTDWETCEKICKLKPGLRVLTCSAFTGKIGDPLPQVAILGRDRAVLSWVDEISEGSGFALAIVQAGSRKLAVFSVQSGKTSTPGAQETADRILAEVKKLQNFPQNRPEPMLVAIAGAVKPSTLNDGGFQTVPTEQRATSDRRATSDQRAAADQGAAAKGPEFWVLNGGFLTRPRNVALPGLRAPLAISDFDTSSPFSSKFAYHTPLLFAGESPAPPPAAVQPAAIVSPQLLGVVLAVVFILVIAALFIIKRRTQTMALQLASMEVGNGSVPQLVNDPVRLNLIAWFKSLFVQRLLSQRQQLLSNEDEATRRTLAIEEKLSTLQTNLQARISAYETRIERLELELTAATFENRDLIRSQIELLKEKVAKAREEQTVRRN